MEQNNEMNSSAVESTSSATAVAVAEPTSAELMPAPKKRGAAKKIITAVLACVVVAGGIFAAKTYLKPDPEKVVKAAVAATYSQQQKMTEEIYNAIPASKRLFEPQSQTNTQAEFKVSFNSIEGIPYSEMVSAMLSGFNISGTAVSASDDISDLLLKVNRKDDTIISVSSFLSPQLATICLPELSAKVLSVNPAAVAVDYKNSVFSKTDPIDDAQLDLLQQNINSAFEYNDIFTDDLTEKLNADLTAKMLSAFKNAQYSYNEQNKLYTVTVPGADMKAAIIDIYRYVYLDSDIAVIIERLLAPTLALAGEESYTDATQRLIGEIESSCPELPTTIELDIQNKVIKTAYIVLRTEDNAVTEIQFDFTENGTTVKTDITIPAGDDILTSSTVASATFKDGVYSIIVNADTQGAGSKATMPFELSIADSGAFECKFDMDMAANDSMAVSLGFTASGTVSENDGIFSISLPEAIFTFGSNGKSYALNIGYDSITEPLSEVPAAPAEHIPVFSMSENDIDLLSDDIEVGMRSVIGKLYTAFLGQ